MSVFKLNMTISVNKSNLILQKWLIFPKVRPFSSRVFTQKFDESSNLHRIESTHENPMDLFKEWYGEHITRNPEKAVFKVFSFSTASKNGRVSSRSLLLRNILQDGFVIMTDKRSEKCKQMEENPNASMVFLWLKDSNIRQVRVEGNVQKLDVKDTEKIFSNEPLFAKLRAYICHQDQPVNWQDLKRVHDQLLEKVTSENLQLTKPDHVDGYKLIPQFMEFYEATDQSIGDRLRFIRNTSDSAWTKKRIAA